MNPRLEELLARIAALQEDVEDTYREAREEWNRQRREFAAELQRSQRRFKVGLMRYLLTARPLVVMTAPVIYVGWIAFLLLDLFVTVYQAVCFPIYGIPKVRRSSYLIFDRGMLPYLNLIERFNCVYCSYGNGVIAYAREIAGRTEQHWCPIKHARRVLAAHDRYPRFTDHGDAERYRAQIERLRQDFEDLRERSVQNDENR